MNIRPRILATISGASLLILSGCGVELSGEDGNLNFYYLNTQLQSGVSSGTLATGARIDVALRVPDSDENLPVRDAVSEDSSILDVTNVASHRFTLEGVAPGSARVTGEATVDGESVTDSVEISVANVDSLRLGVRCSDPVFVTDSRAQFSYRMYDAAGSKLTGYGRYDVDVEPAAGGTVNDSITAIELLEISTGSEPGEYLLVPTVGDEEERESFAFELVAPGDITFASITDNDQESATTVAAGQEVAIALFTLETDDKNVCGPADAAVQLSTSTPDICDVSYSFFGDLHILNVQGISEGNCEINFSVPDTDISVDYAVDVTA